MRNKLIAVVVVGLCVLMTAAFVRHRSNTNETVGEIAPVELFQLERLHAPVTMIRFVLFKKGIQPRQMKAREGFVNIAIEDKTHSSDGLVIERAIGAELITIAQIRRVLNYERGRQVIRLSAGTYTVFDASAPNNRAELVVEP